MKCQTNQGNLGAQLTSKSVPECSCESFSTAPHIFHNESTPICPCSYGKVTLVPATFTTVFTIYDPIISESLASTSELTTLSNASHTGTSNTVTLDSIVSTIASSVSISWFHHPNATISSGKSSSVHLNHTSTSSGVFWTGPSTMIDGKISSRTLFWDNTTKGLFSSLLSTPGSNRGANTTVSLRSPVSSIHTQPLVCSSSILSEPTTPDSLSSSAPAATPTASSTLPAQTTSTIAVPNTRRTSSKVSSISTLATSTIVPVIVPPGGITTVEPLTATLAEADGTYKTTSVTWLSIEIPTTTSVSGNSIATHLPACISLDLCSPSCLVPEEVCLPNSSSNSNGYPWPEKPRLPPSPDNSSTIPTSSAQLTAPKTDPSSGHTTITRSGGSRGSDGDHNDGEDGDDGSDDDDGENNDSGNDDNDSDDDDGDNNGDDSDDDDDDDEDSFLNGLRIDLGINFGIDLGNGFGTSVLSTALRDIFGFGVSIGFGTNSPSGGGGGGGGGGGNGETEPDKPKESITTSELTSSSCTVTYTLAPHCTQPCVVSQIKSLGTSSYTTSCATATCRTTQVCTSIRTTTTTSFTTKRPERTAACMPKKCPVCQRDTLESSLKKLEVSWGRGHPQRHHHGARYLGGGRV
ncbi:hypothetical protein CSUB01_07041 [Colletotrichum sublineola]|uniref:Uncharacterized protein n=1 Tax=Colletotrichum sublineola TaxID=1173701 RepID=A0A066WW16_COLSU|nr:hypothetical protein CSUB01_07041 [Colletotrichum sublineola]